MMQKVLPLPPGGRRVIIGHLQSGALITQFNGSSWSVMDLRTTFCGMPQYKLVEQLRGMHDVTGWTPGILLGDKGNV